MQIPWGLTDKELEKYGQADLNKKTINTKGRSGGGKRISRPRRERKLRTSHMNYTATKGRKLNGRVQEGSKKKKNVNLK